MSDLGRADRPHRAGLVGARSLTSLVKVDDLFAALVFTASMFIMVLPGGPVIFVALPVMFALLRFQRLGRLAPCLPLLAIPIYALASALWSAIPGTTAYYATQYLLTVLLGCMLGALIDERALLHGLFVAFLLFAIVNVMTGLAAGTMTLTDFYGHAPFIGLMQSKNAQADMSALGGMIALSALIFALRGRRLLMAVAAAALIGMTVLTIANAQSTGAIVSLMIGAAMILTFTASRVLPIQARFGIFAVVALVAIVALATRHLWYEPLLDYVLKTAGKDSTLTGRTYIWERAQVAIAQHPLLGVGFAGFWQHGNLEAEAIWRALFIESRSGFNFHNTYYEFRVHFGLVGVIVAAAAVVPAVLLLLVRTVRAPTEMSVLFTAVVAYEIGRMNFESIAMAPFHYTTMILFAALAHAVRRAAPAAATTRAAPAKPARAWRSVQVRPRYGQRS